MRVFSDLGVDLGLALSVLLAPDGFHFPSTILTLVFTICSQLPRSENPRRHALYLVITMVLAHSAFSNKLIFLIPLTYFNNVFIMFFHVFSRFSDA